MSETNPEFHFSSMPREAVFQYLTADETSALLDAHQKSAINHGETPCQNIDELAQRVTEGIQGVLLNDLNWVATAFQLHYLPDSENWGPDINPEKLHALVKAVLQHDSLAPKVTRDSNPRG